MFNSVKCKQCQGKIKESFDFCPHCGLDLRNPGKDSKNYGLLGKNNHIEGMPVIGGAGLDLSDKMMDSMMKSLFKILDKQMRAMGGDVQVQVGQPKQQVRRKSITKEQQTRMIGLPRVPAKTNVRRLSDKVVYELDAPGIESIEDVFVSKVESGYELKAIAKKKVYVTSLPVNLPLKSYSLHDSGLTVEFGLQ